MARTSNRARRRVVARLLETSRAAEARYVRALRSLVAAANRDVQAFLTARADATAPAGFEEHVMRVVGELRVRVGVVYDRHARAIDGANKKAMRVVGVKVSDLGITAEIAKRRDENIELVVKAQRAYAQSVKEIIEAPENVGLRVEDLKDKLLERGDVSESRAELIARDQTLKLNGAITQIRQQNAGVDEYTWSTSLDERVRPEHAALEGQRFSWSSPPAPGHPGQDYQCRCVALPVISELEGL